MTRDALAMTIEWLPIGMFIALAIFILSGFPVAFTLSGVALGFALIGMMLDAFHPGDLGFMPARIFGIVNNFTLVAVPLFILMGQILERSGVAGDLLSVVSKLTGRLRGHLAFVVILVGALLAATTGIVGASVVTLTLLTLPRMIADGYDKRLSCGVIASSGTLGQIIPPSIVLILIGDVLNLDVGDVFVGALIPGILLVGSYLVLMAVLLLLRPDLFPRTAADPSHAEPFRVFSWRDWEPLVSPTLLVLAVLGSILAGWASPTEASSFGVVGALVLACTRRLQRRTVFSRKDVSEALRQTVTTSAMVFWLLIGAQFFSVVFRGLSGDELIYHFFENADLAPTQVVAVIMLLVFMLGFFLDFLEICFIVLPLFLPVLQSTGVDLLWLAILVGVNLQTSFLTPPFGFSLFYLKGAAPAEVKTIDIYRGVIPFIAVQLFVLGLLWIWPDLVTILPRTLNGTHAVLTP